MSAIIKTIGLTKQFKGGGGVFQLDLEVPAGAVFALLGDNGAGKSTTFKVFVAFLRLNFGRKSI